MYEGQIMMSAFDRVENIVGKGENAGYHNVFKSLLSKLPDKFGIVWQRVWEGRLEGTEKKKKWDWEKELQKSNPKLTKEHDSLEECEKKRDLDLYSTVIYKNFFVLSYKNW